MRYLLLPLLLLGCTAVTEPGIPAIENMAVYQHEYGGYNYIVITADITAGCRLFAGVEMPQCYWGYSQWYDFTADGMTFPHRLISEFWIPRGYTGDAICTVGLTGGSGISDTMTVIVE